MNKLAVILPAYNAEHFLIEAIDAILNQSFKEFDLYIIDDCYRFCYYLTKFQKNI